MSEKKLGYGVESTGAIEKPFVEVKSFASTGPLELTPNEWQMVRCLAKNY